MQLSKPSLKLSFMNGFREPRRRAAAKLQAKPHCTQTARTSSSYRSAACKITVHSPPSSVSGSTRRHISRQDMLGRSIAEALPSQAFHATSHLLACWTARARGRTNPPPINPIARQARFPHGLEHSILIQQAAVSDSCPWVSLECTDHDRTVPSRDLQSTPLQDAALWPGLRAQG